MGGPRGGPARPAPDEDPDRELLARHAAGDREAFGELFARHRDRLWAVAPPAAASKLTEPTFWAEPRSKISPVPLR